MTRHTVYLTNGTSIKGVNYYGVIAKNEVKLAQVTSVQFDGTVNKPKLSAGMTPVKWSGSTWVDLNSSEQLNVNHEWYDYSNTGVTANKWANAKLKDGSLLVWIPRYTYGITYNNVSNRSQGGTIDIRFSRGTADDTSGGYRIHPAFYWGGWTIPASSAMVKQPGGTELTGIWVGKFESSDNGSGRIAILAGVSSLRNIAIDSMFTMSRNMQSASNAPVYGISTDSNVVDTHMIKNSEWGAMAYLSKYASGATEIAKNTSFTTAGSGVSASKAQSTTRNEYGVYDMNGGASEYVASYIPNGDSSLDTYCSSLKAAANQYKDVFPVGTPDSFVPNYNAASQAYGYALNETSSRGDDNAYGWFGDYSQYPNTIYPVFIRGGNSLDASTWSGVYCYISTTGHPHTSNGFRVSISVL